MIGNRRHTTASKFARSFSLKLWRFGGAAAFCLFTTGCVSPQIATLPDIEPEEPSQFVPQEARAIATHDDLVLAVAFAGNSGALATGAVGHEVKLWKLPKGELRQKILVNSSFPHSLTFSPDGTRLLSGGMHGGFTQWNEAPKAAPWHQQHGTTFVRGLNYSPDGRWIVSAAALRNPKTGQPSHETLRLWQAGSGKLVSEVKVEGMVYAVSFLSNDTLAVVLQDTKTQVRLLTVKVQGKLHTPRVLRTMKFKSGNSQAVIDAASKTVAIVQRKSGVDITSIANSNAPLRHLPIPGVITSLALAPGGKKLVVARLLPRRGSTLRAQLQVWDLVRNTPGPKLTLGCSVSSAAFSPDGRTIAFSAWNSAYLWDWDK